MKKNRITTTVITIFFVCSFCMNTGIADCNEICVGEFNFCPGVASGDCGWNQFWVCINYSCNGTEKPMSTKKCEEFIGSNCMSYEVLILTNGCEKYCTNHGCYSVLQKDLLRV
jgi:hypothetical protein